MIRLLFIASLLGAAACAPRYRTRLEPSCPPHADAQLSPLPGDSGVLRGVVHDLDTGQPVRGAYLQISPTTQTATTDSAGAFAFQLLPPGHYILTSRRLGYEVRSDTIVLGEQGGVKAQLALVPAAFDRCMELRAIVLIFCDSTHA